MFMARWRTVVWAKWKEAARKDWPVVAAHGVVCVWVLLIPVAWRSDGVYFAWYCMFPMVALALLVWSLVRRIPLGLALAMWLGVLACFAVIVRSDRWFENRFFDYRYDKLSSAAREIAEGRDASEDLTRRCGARSIQLSVEANGVRVITFWFPSGPALLATELYLTSDRKLLPSGRQPVRTDDLGSWYLSDRYD